MNKIVSAHREYRAGLRKKLNPLHDWQSASWSIHHVVEGQDDKGAAFNDKDAATAHRYPVQVQMPPDWKMPDFSAEKDTPRFMVRKAVVQLQKAGEQECNGGRWITVHPNGDNEKGHPVYICPNPDGSHTVVSGAGGKLNGLRMTGVKSQEEYAEIGKQKRDEAKRQGKLKEEIRKRQVGVQQFQEEQEGKKAVLQESAGTTYQKQRDGIAAVFAAQGIDPSFMDVPTHLLAGTDPKTAEIIKKRYHKKLLSYAKQMTGAIRSLVAAGLDGISEANLGDVGIGDLIHSTLGDTGTGYASPVRALSEELGIDVGEKNAAIEGLKTRSLLERSDMDLGAVKKKREANADMQESRAQQEAKIKDAVNQLAEQGLGPAAVAQFSVAPKVATVGQAVEVLRAMKEVQQAESAHSDLKRQLSFVDEVAALPKTALMTAKPMSEGDIKNAIAADIDEDSRRSSMISLVTKSNAAEEEHGSLRSHLSVGQNLAFNTAAAAVDGSTVDPLVHDILGSSGAANVMVARWRASLPPDAMDKLREAFGAQHVATQKALADSAVAEAGEYMAAAEQIGLTADGSPSPLPSTPEELEGAVLQQEEKSNLLRKARAALGVARGRLEAAAALNEALMKDQTGPIAVSLGGTDLNGAMNAALALGLGKPTVYDPETGALKEDGDFDIKTDGQNAIISLRPSGIERLAGKVDPVALRRAERSRAIKNGEEDEPDWVPEGLTRRPVSSYEVEAIQLKPADLRVGIEAGDNESAIAEKVGGFIGAMMNRGRDPLQIESLMRSEDFKAGLGLSDTQRKRYEATLNAMSPQWMPDPSVRPSDAEGTRRELDRYEAFKQEREDRFSGYLQNHLASAGTSPEDIALDGQQLPLDAVTSDCAYTALLSSPPLQLAFKPYGDMDHQDRAAARRWANVKMFGQAENATDDIITPLSPEQRRAYEGWTKLQDTHGDPYGAIQADWRESLASGGDDLFGEPAPVNPLSTIDVNDAVATLALARANPKLLGYEPVAIRDKETGQPTLGFPMLDADEDRPESVILADVKGRIKGKLREHFLASMQSQPDLAAQGFNPGGVRTGSDRFAEYVRSMGSDKAAYGAVQEFMKGELLQTFAGQYQARTGKQLTMATRPIAGADKHAEAMLPPEIREAMQGMDSSTRAKYMKRSGGKFAVTGSVKDAADLDTQQQSEGARLFADGSSGGDDTSGGRNVNTERATIGKTAEAVLAGIVPHLDVSRQTAAASGLNFSTEKGLPIQRSIRLIEANFKQGINLGTGTGKTVVGIGAYTHLRAKGKAHRALFVVPSNIVDQFPAEIDKFRDPSITLHKWASSGASGEERRAALANPNLHITITTAEALREDVVRMVADNENMTVEEAAEKLRHPDTKSHEVDDLVHRALAENGVHHDFVLTDEAHRLLSREGKPDALMARVADSIGRRANYLVSATADIIKNDSSEAHSVLSKLDPDRYPPESSPKFNRQYGRNTLASGVALQRVMEPYTYAKSVNLGIDTDQQEPDEGALKLTDEQQGAHDVILGLYKRARIAKMRGGIDVEAIKQLSPNSFRDAKTPEDEAAVASGLSTALATTRDAALNRVVNAFPGGVKENWVAKEVAARKGEPTVVFCHSLDGVKNIAARLKKEGHQVAVLTGEMSTQMKTKARLAFQPAKGEPTATVLISSDAGSVGANLQRGKSLINVDVPQTAMLHQQRIGRIRRTGQEAKSVRVRDLVADSPFDQDARRLLQDKGALRELLTSPVLDDSGEFARIQATGVRRLLANAGMEDDAAVTPGGPTPKL